MPMTLMAEDVDHIKGMQEEFVKKKPITDLFISDLILEKTSFVKKKPITDRFISDLILEKPSFHSYTIQILGNVFIHMN